MAYKKININFREFEIFMWKKRFQAQSSNLTQYIMQLGKKEVHFVNEKFDQSHELNLDFLSIFTSVGK